MRVFLAAAHRVLTGGIPLVVPPWLHACSAVVIEGDVVPVRVAVVPVFKAFDSVDGALGEGLQLLNWLLLVGVEGRRLIGVVDEGDLLWLWLCLGLPLHLGGWLLG